MPLNMQEIYESGGRTAYLAAGKALYSRVGPYNVATTSLQAHECRHGRKTDISYISNLIESFFFSQTETKLEASGGPPNCKTSGVAGDAVVKPLARRERPEQATLRSRPDFGALCFVVDILLQGV